MNDIELKEVVGGISFSSTLVNSLVKGIQAMYDLGRRVGSALARYKSNNLCGF